MNDSDLFIPRSQARHINEVLTYLDRAWRAAPHLRLGQLLHNATGTNDLFYIDDDTMKRFLFAYAAAPSNSEVK